MMMTLQIAPAFGSRRVRTHQAVQVRSTSRPWGRAAAAAFAAAGDYDASLTRCEKRAVVVRFQQQV